MEHGNGLSEGRTQKILRVDRVRSRGKGADLTRRVEHSDVGR